MNTLMDLLGHPLMYKLGWTLVHFLWQGTAIAALFALAQTLLRHRSANARYLAGCCALALMLAAPIATFTLRLTDAPGARAIPGAAFEPSASQASETLALSGTTAQATGMRPAIQRVADFAQIVVPRLTPLWMAGVLLLTLRLARGGWIVQRFKHCPAETVDAFWTARLEELKLRLEISRPVRLLKTALVEVPTVVGWLRPVILLPISSLTGLTTQQLESVLAHELAHIRRHDYLVNAFQMMVETLLFYHPAVWWISRCVREERENCCDDLAIAVCGDRLGYARALATLEELRVSPPWAFAASGGSLLQRIRRLLGLAPDGGTRRLQVFSGVALLAVGLVLIALAVSQLLAPAQCQATATIRTYQVSSGPQPGSYAPGVADSDPYFLRTESKVIRSDVILTNVIESLKLREEWGKKYARGGTLSTPEAMQLLKGRLNVRPIPNTSLVEVHCFSDDKDEAARIANAVGETYCFYRVVQNQKLAHGGIDALKSAFDQEEDKIKKVQQDADDLRKKLQISDVDAAGAGPTPLLETDVLRHLKALSIEHEQVYITKEKQLSQLQELAKDNPEKLKYVLPTIVSDPFLVELNSQLNQAQQNLVTLKQDFADGHPGVVRARAVVDDSQKKLNERVDGIMLALQNQVQSEKAALDRLNAEVGAAITNDALKTEMSRPYYDKKRELDSLMRFREILVASIAYEKVDAKLPGTFAVEIVEHAEPPPRPTLPNYPRTLGTLLLGVILSAAGCLLLLLPPIKFHPAQ